MQRSPTSAVFATHLPEADAEGKDWEGPYLLAWLLTPFSASEHSLLPRARLADPDQLPERLAYAARVRPVGSPGVKAQERKVERRRQKMGRPEAAQA